MQILLDSNVIIAAFSARGLCHALFELCVDRYRIILSDHILTEISRNLLEKFKIPRKIVTEIIDYLIESCEIHQYGQLEKSVCRDKDDDEILALARALAVDYIITGDQDLLVLGNFQSIPIVSPRDFWSIIKDGKTNDPESR